MLFRKRPVVVDAEQFWPDKPLPFSPEPYVAFDGERWYVTTAHNQTATLAPGDWIIKEPSGPGVVAFAAYPCKPDIFEASYTPVE